MLKTAGEAGEAGDVKTGWVLLSTSAPLRLITSGEARAASVVARNVVARGDDVPGDDAGRERRQSDRRPPQISAIYLHYVWAYMLVF